MGMHMWNIFIEVLKLLVLPIMFLISTFLILVLNCRALRNRESVARLKMQKAKHFQDLKCRTNALKMECSSLSAQVQSRQVCQYYHYFLSDNVGC